MKPKRLTPIVLTVLAGAAIAAGALAFSPAGAATGFRISFTGTDGDSGPEAANPDAAYNPTRREFMVAWQADPITEGDNEIYARRVSLAGTPLGGTVRVSETGVDTETTQDSLDPAVAFNGKLKQYLVVWDGDKLTDNEGEVFGQRLSATGAPLGTDDFRISTVGTEGDTTQDADDPHLAYNSKSNQYLVVWEGDHQANGEIEIFAQRLSGAGADLGGDFRLSTTGADGDDLRDAEDPEVAYNAKLNQYLAVWEGDQEADDAQEIYGQRVSAAGAQLGGDLRMSVTGPEGDPTRGAANPSVAANSKRGQYLVAWQGDPFVALDSDVFGQRFGSAGNALAARIRIATSGPDVPPDADRNGFSPALAYNSTANEYVATWIADPVTVDDDEIYGQRISAAGRQLDGDFRVSTTGTDGDIDRAAENTDVATGGRVHLAVWDSDGLPTDDEFEIFGRRIVAPKCFGKAPTIVGTSKRDVLRGTRKRDVIVGLGGPDKLIGRGGPDLLCGNKGQDKLRGGKGRDRTKQ